jgi:hypothetical protein
MAALGAAAAAGKPMRLVLVEWADAYGGERSGWRPLAKMTEAPVVTTSVGYLASCRPDAVLIVPHVTADGDGDGEIYIPRGWITRIAELAPAPAAFTLG